MKKVAILLLLQILLYSACATAKDFPSKPLTLLIGFDRGGTVFTQAEALAEVLTDILNQPVTVQVRSGLGGGIAAAMVAQSQSESYIMLFTPSLSITNSPHTQPAFEVDDFRYLGAISEDQNALVTYSDAPFSSWTEFLEYAKQKDEILYASQNLTDRHFINVIAEQEGLNIRIIPVSGGAGMAPLVLGKDVDLAFSGGTHNRYVDSEQMKVIASVSVNRLSEHPDTPTLQELGYGIGSQSLRIVAVPKNIPEDHFTILANALKQAVADPRLIQVIRDVIRHPVMFMDESELHRFIRDNRSQYLELITTIENEN
ncbi:tripartite tricarboxylate transporter substrate binding protein [Nitrincola schmidtii]|uniref:tripartite tricarboxylate transporter substrate binding protein n=1 Tax=Nitrincola schmidtii TaxID=1730894 RepID=UPI00124CEAFC|nr:tripartite tricarboxylate transporter substrate binding protein [Nitrincola schmidtii]